MCNGRILPNEIAGLFYFFLDYAIAKVMGYL